MQREGVRFATIALCGEQALNNDTHTYRNCLSHCAKGVRCRFAAGRGEAHRCALLYAGDLPGGPARSRRIWFDILRKGSSHGHR